MADEHTEFASSALGAHSIRNPRVEYEKSEYKRGGETGAVAGMKVAVKQLHLSARAYHRVLKLARTISDLGGEERVQVQHVAEALQYRSRQLTA